MITVSFAPVAAQDLSDKADPHDVWLEARRSQLQIQLDHAKRLKERLQTDPNNLMFKLDLARAYYWLGLERHEASRHEAERLFSEILEREPNHPTALVYHGSVIGLKIDGSLSVEHTEELSRQCFAEQDRAVALAPDDIEIRKMRAYGGYYTPSFYGRDALVVEDITAVLRLLKNTPENNDERARMYLLRGDTHKKTERFSEAQADWRRAAEIETKTGWTRRAADQRFKWLTEATANSLNAKKLAAFFGFLLGTVIFSILLFLLWRDAVGTVGRRRQIGAALAVSGLAWVWNAVQFASMTLIAFRVRWVGELPISVWDRGWMLLVPALLPIPLGLMLTYRLYKAVFMDLLLKRGAVVLTLLALVVVYANFIEQPLEAVFVRLSDASLRPVISTGFWLGLVLLYAPLRDAVYRVIDRLLFKRRDYARLLDGLDARLSGLTDTPAVIAFLTEFVKNGFAAVSARFVPISDDDDSAVKCAALCAETGSDVVLTQQIADESLHADLERRRIELIVEVRSGDEILGVLLVGSRAYGQGWLSEELTVLRTATVYVRHTLDTLRLHDVRRRQAIGEEQLRKLAVEAELKALRAQIDPHFFFNALNSIAALIEKSPKEAEDLIADVSELFRHAFKQSREFVSLREELDLVETYLKIEHVRLGNKLQFRKAVTPPALDAALPALTIQPLVENAVKHGIGRLARGGVITLSATVTPDGLFVGVADTGVGMSAEKTADVVSNGVGLGNVNARLVNLYGDGAKLNVDYQPGQGTTVSFVIPAKPVEIQGLGFAQNGVQGSGFRVQERKG